MPDRAPRWSLWLVVSAVVVAADLATKAWVSRVFAPGEVLEVTSFFNLVLTHNTGAAFSFLAGAGGWQRWFFTAIAVAISAAIVVLLPRQRDPWMAAALALVLGGALGNLYDRLTLGRVVDFVQLHAGGYYWPAFNVADSAITVGVLLLVWDSLRGRRVQTTQGERS
ncbi:MAG TPA: signal peptidase II [Usitatibacter sp.]|jgi:signal peptidase II|nr:signal peptidase II [Usitatibacter sp.]